MNILVVDDHADTAEMLGALLRLRGHAVQTVNDPLAALAATRDFHPDAAVLDIGLPAIDGYELAGHLRANGASYPLVVVSGRAQRDARRCAQLGIDAYFAKPVDFDALVAAVERTA
jgi:DNA-binding response OmpR family regulator